MTSSSPDIESRPTVYENEDGDYWVRVDQVAGSREAQAAVLEQTGPEPIEYAGIETVPLSECEWGCGGQEHLNHPPSVERPAHHFIVGGAIG